jgi:hypothetical protein
MPSPGYDLQAEPNWELRERNKNLIVYARRIHASCVDKPQGTISPVAENMECPDF